MFSVELSWLHLLLHTLSVSLFSLFYCGEEALLPHLLPLWNLFISTSPPSFTRALKCGSYEMKRLMQVKLFSSPHCTFLVVIHSWQNPFTLWQPMSPLMYGVFLPSRPPQCAPGSLLPCTPTLLILSWISLKLRQDMTSGFAGLFIYVRLLWYMAEKIRWWGWAPRNLFRITRLRVMSPPCECEWRREINAIAPLSLSPSLSCSSIFIHISFSEHATPAVSQSDLGNSVWGRLKMNMIAL